MHDARLGRVTLHVAQQHLLHVAVEREVEDGRVEPLVLAGKPDVVVFQLDADGLQFAAVDDRRDLVRVTQAAARTLALVSAFCDLDFMNCHGNYLLLLR